MKANKTHMALELRGNSVKTHCGLYFNGKSNRFVDWGELNYTDCQECRDSYRKSEKERLSVFSDMKRNQNFINKHQKDAVLKLMHKYRLSLQEIRSDIRMFDTEQKNKIAKFHQELDGISILTTFDFQSDIFGLTEKAIRQRIAAYNERINYIPA